MQAIQPIMVAPMKYSFLLSLVITNACSQPAHSPALTSPQLNSATPPRPENKKQQEPKTHTNAPKKPVEMHSSSDGSGSVRNRGTGRGSTRNGSPGSVRNGSPGSTQNGSPGSTRNGSPEKFDFIIQSIPELPPSVKLHRHIATNPPRRQPTDMELTKQSIRQVMRQSFPKFKRCYTIIDRSPTLANYTIGFTINKNGMVSSTIADGLPAKTSQCFKQTLQSLRFSPPPGGGSVKITYPMNIHWAGE